MIDLKVYSPIKRAADYLGLTMQELCNFILEQDVPIYAWSYATANFESEGEKLTEDVFRVKSKSVESVLAADKTVETVQFVYPARIQKRRMGSWQDSQRISRKDLYLLTKRLDEINEMLDIAPDAKNAKDKRSRIKLKTSRIKQNNGQGCHWELKGRSLLSAANVELRKNAEKYVKIKSQKINYDKLARFLDKHREKWSNANELNKRKLSIKTISGRLSKYDKQGVLHYPKN